MTMNNTIVTVDLKQYISNDKLSELVKIANDERTYLNNRYRVEYLKDCLDRRAIEIIFKGTKYQDRSNIEKIIIANNIVFSNQKYADILNTGNFDIKSLKAFLKLVNYFINNVSDDDLSDDDKRYLEIVKKFERKLINHFKKQVGVTDSAIIINKLNELLSFEPELLEENKNKHTR